MEKVTEHDRTIFLKISLETALGKRLENLFKKYAIDMKRYKEIQSVIKQNPTSNEKNTIIKISNFLKKREILKKELEKLNDDNGIDIKELTIGDCINKNIHVFDPDWGFAFFGGYIKEGETQHHDVREYDVDEWLKEQEVSKTDLVTEYFNNPKVKILTEDEYDNI